MADAANASLRYPESFNEFLALMERWHTDRDVTIRPGECIGMALKRSSDTIQAVTEVARLVWDNAERGRTAGVTVPHGETFSRPDADALESDQ